MCLQDHPLHLRPAHQADSQDITWMSIAQLTWPGFLLAVAAACSTALAFFFSFFFSLSAKVPRILDIISESVFAYWILCFNDFKIGYFSFKLVINIFNYYTNTSQANLKHIFKEILKYTES